jgi:hypothetical protein
MTTERIAAWISWERKKNPGLTREPQKGGKK